MNPWFWVVIAAPIVGGVIYGILVVRSMTSQDEDKFLRNLPPTPHKRE